MEKVLFDKGWKYKIEDLEPHCPESRWGGAKAGAYDFGATAKKCDEDDWRSVDLPYDYVREGRFVLDTADTEGMGNIPEMQSIRSRLHAGGCLEPKVAWFRKHFIVNKEDLDKNYVIKFDGVYRNCDVYVNQKYVGSYRSGYTYFYFEISDFLVEGENLICVRVDPREREGWWYEGGGIYRHVWIYKYEELMILPYENKVEVFLDEEKKKADITVSAQVVNRSYKDKDITVSFLIIDEKNAKIAESHVDLNVADWEMELAKSVISLKEGSFELWSVDNPVLYTLKTTIKEKDNNRSYRCEDVVFGIRKVEFTADDGFYLNGKRLKIKGLCVHQDHSGVGIGMPDSVVEYRLREMKKMGMNAIRSAHHQPSDVLLDLCDRLGILVFSENRRMSSAEEDIDQLRKVIKQGRNHPCVFLWGIGNEEINIQHLDETIKVTERLKREIRRLDSTRNFTSAIVCWDGKDRFEYATKYFGVAQHLDVMGFNYCDTAWDDYHAHFPDQPVIITEIDAANSSARGIYSTDESKGHFFTLDPDNANKCTDIQRVKKRFEIGEKFWKETAKRQYLAGAFLWTGIDYRGEPTPMPWPAVSSTFGILDYCGFRKDSFYYYQSWWGKKPTIHLFPHWNNPVNPGEMLTVYAYCNMDEIELFVNGKSYGRKAVKSNWYVQWENVVYEPGVLESVGTRGEKEYFEKVVTTKKIDKLMVRKYEENILTSDNISIWNIDVVDEDGRTVPDACPLIRIVTGKGTTLIGAGNGDPSCHESELSCERHAFNGKLQVTASSDGEPLVEAEIISFD